MIPEGFEAWLREECRRLFELSEASDSHSAWTRYRGVLAALGEVAERLGIDIPRFGS